MPRPLTDADAEALVVAASRRRRQHQARSSFRRRPRSCSSGGARCSTVTPIDDSSCVIHTGADTVEQLAAWLGMLDADFKVSGPPELVKAVRVMSSRFAAATA
jgi:hypothetical protein